MENQASEAIVPQRSKFNPILLAAIGVAILAAGVGIGLIAGKYFQPASSSSSVSIIPSSSSSTVAPTGAADPTASWKTYINSEDGFEFQYPSDLEIKETVDGGNIKTKSGNNFSFIVVHDESLSISDFLTKSDKKSLKDNGALHALQVQSTKKTIVNGLNVVQREEHLPDSDITQISTYLKNGSVVISMTITPFPGSDRDESLYNQILSTFKFLNIAELKSYRSGQLPNNALSAFDVKYPDPWILSEDKGNGYLSVSISSKGYTIKIWQGAMDGAACLFNDSPEFDGPSGNLRNKSFVEINGFYKMRRYENEGNDSKNQRIFSFCYKEPNSQYYANPLPIGLVHYEVPLSYDRSILTEMDNIVSSLTSVK